MYSRKWILIDVDSTSKKKMKQLLCVRMKDGYVDSHDKLHDRPHLVIFFSTVQPDFK